MLGKFLLDTWLLFLSHLRTTLRNPVWVIMGLFQPICYMLLFAPLLEGLAASPGLPAGKALNVFAPGMLVMMAVYNTAFVGFGLIDSLRSGVIERLRVTPASRLALLLGMVARDVVTFLVQCTLLVVVALVMGLRPDPVGLPAAVVFLVLIGLVMASCSYALALTLKEEGALAASINSVTLPLTLLSGFFLPMELAPPLLRLLARFNPFAYAVDTARALVNGDLTAPAVPIGFALFVVLAVLALWWAIGIMRQATA
jgi:ABC-2 type transport system permease protein